MRSTILALAVTIAIGWAAPVATAGDAPYQPYLGAYVYPRNRPILNKYVVYYYVGGQQREAYRNYYAPVYPYYSDTAIRRGMYPQRYSTFTPSTGYYWYWPAPSSSSIWSPY